MPSINSVEARDAAYNLHPYTNLRVLEKEGPLVINRGEGVYVYDIHGRKYIEGMAGLWCTSLGFSEQRLIDAATRQLSKLPFYHSFSAKVPTVTTELAERLVSMAPQPLARVMFANSGSESNDTAIKLAWYYNNARQRPEKKKIIARRRAYHGVTIAAGSMTGLAYAQTGFDLPRPGFLHVETPLLYRNGHIGETEKDFATRLAEELDALIVSEGPDTVAAFFAEPVMGAGGVIVPPETYFEKIQAVLRRHDVLMVADEVICGFGRTGNMFGCETFNIRPDMMVVAKQLSSAYQPISALLVSDDIYQVIADQSDSLGTFGHGYTYSGHPVPAAVALETLKIYEERQIVQRIRDISPFFFEQLQRFADHPLVGNVRGIGLIAGIELVQDKTTRVPFPAKAAMAAFLVKKAQENGVILRALPGDTVAVCPPLIIKEDEIREIFVGFEKALLETAAHARTLTAA